MNPLSYSAALLVALQCGTPACAATEDRPSADGNSNASSSGAFDPGPSACSCSPDMRSVLDCQGNVIETCSDAMVCDAALGTCSEPCAAAAHNKSSVGCEYYATFMDAFNLDVCFAAFVANTWDSPVHLTAERAGASLPIESFTRIPKGSGPSLTYEPYDAAAGLPPGEVAILFLSGPEVPPNPDDPSASVVCPVPSAVPTGVMIHRASGIGESFRITSDRPVVAYQINPYGGGKAAITGASLLLPTSVWDANYVAVNAWESDPEVGVDPSLNIVASENDTSVTLLPTADVTAAPGIPFGHANKPLELTLQRGQHAQISQKEALTGSILQSTKPIGLMGGHQCMNVPVGQKYCDHGEQMIPPVKALGSEYVGVMHRPRAHEMAVWRLVGAVDGTTLTWSTPVGGPLSIGAGELKQFATDQPFVVASQDDSHPFMLFQYMTGGAALQEYGDPDFVLVVPSAQYMKRYVFFADPTYPETNLVIVRAKEGAKFHDVTLDCTGTLQGWKTIGEYQWTRVDLSTGNFQAVGNCGTGRREIQSDGPFGLWVWGWGTPLTGGPGEPGFTGDVSYAYPAGMSVKPVNGVSIPAIPK